MQLSATTKDATLNARLAIDAQAVGDLRSRAARDPKGAAREVAGQFEKMFLDMVLKSMREATPKFDELESESAGMFRGMYDQQLTQTMTSGHGLGLADVISAQVERMSNPASLQVPLHRAQRGAVTWSTPAVATPASGAVPASSEHKADDFVATVGQAALSAAQSLGLSPHLMLAHAALESGWGKKPITDAQGNNSYNLFGIKASKDWAGKTTDITTTEYVDGVAQKRVERFRAYDSYADAFGDYARLLAKRYGDATQAGSDAKVFATELQDGGYATDPAYAKKLARVADHPALKAYKALS